MKTGRKDIEDIIALTPMQEGMLFHYLQNPGSDYYFEQLSLEISGEIQGEIFEGAWNFVIETNEMLRTLFHWENVENPVQIILKEHKIQPGYHDFSGEEPGERQERLEKVRINDREKKFDLKQVPSRINLYKLETDKYRVIISNHHILYDGWSTGIILKEFFKAYDDLSRSKYPVKPVKTRFKEFIHWLQNQDMEKQEKYWRHYLEGFEVCRELPVKRKKKVQAGHNKTYAWKWTREKTAEITGFIKKHQLTLASLLYSAWGILLQKYNNCDDVVFGTTVSGRSAKLAGIEEMVGLFINTLPLRTRSGPHERAVDLLKRMERELRLRQNYEHSSLVNIRKCSEISQGQELFDTLVILENYPLEKRLITESTGLSIDTFSMFEMTHYDLTVSITTFDEIEVKVIYHSDLFADESIERLIDRFTGIVETVMENPGQLVAEIEIISKEEKNKILYDFNDTQAEYPAHKTIHQLFAEQVEQRPDNIAVIGEMQNAESKPQTANRKEPCAMRCALTYRELDNQSHRLARILTGKGVKPDIIVGIMVERSIELIIGILGILKAGGAYLPIDPDYPEERIDYMLKDSSAKILLKDKDLAPEAFNNFTKGTSSFGVWNLEFGISPRQGGQLVYIIYTSGSTGKAKGVLVDHGNVARLVKNANFIHAAPGDRLLLTGALVFDITTFETWYPLLNGLALYLASQEVILHAGELRDFLVKNRITILHLIPQLFNALVGQRLDIFKGLRYFLVGGDLVMPNSINRLRHEYPHLKIIHCYGPTENTTFSTTLSVDRDYPERLPIGRPIQNSSVYIINRHGRLQPIGVAGELVTSGRGVARGYLNNPELTAEKFCLRRPGGSLYQRCQVKVTGAGEKTENILRNNTTSNRVGAPHPRLLDPRKNFLLEQKEQKVPGKNHLQSCNHAIMKSYIHASRQYQPLPPHYPITPLPHHPIYLTGDLARWLPDGNIEFLSRIDQQVKIRGFRIELGEIENHLLTHRKIKQAIVLAKQDNNDKYLCAYIVAERKAYGAEREEINKLREYLSQYLPDYMVPAYFVQLDNIPLTPNGKIDRKALPEPEMKRGKNYITPRNEIEKKLLDIWSEILDVEKEEISMNDNFFHLGGHSLKATLLASRIHKEFNIYIPLSEIFKTPHIRGLAVYIKKSARSKPIPVEPIEKKEYYPLSSAQRRLYILQQMDEQGIGYNMPSIWQVEGNLDNEKLETVFQQLIRRHESLRTFFPKVSDEPVQRVGGETVIGHWSLVIGEADRSEIDDTIISFVKPFDLSQAPLLRVGLIKLLHTPAAPRAHPSQEGKEEKYLLMVDMHHIISDGLSIGIFVKEFMEMYAGKILPRVKLQYKDFSQWQNRQARRESIKQQETYWLNQFSGETPVLDLPTDYPRPAVQNFAGADIHFDIGKEETTALKSLAHQYDVTLFILLLSVYTVLLSKLSGQEDIVVGIPIAGRRQTDLEGIIGMFVNTLELRNFPFMEKTFNLFLGEIKENTIKAFENQDYLYEDLVDQVEVERDTGRNPLFDTMFVLQNMDIPTIQIPGLKVTPYHYESRISKFDLTLTALEIEGHLAFTFEYSIHLFKEETIRRFIGYLNKIISTILENDESRISGIEIITGEEMNRVLYEFNDTAADYPKDKTIHRLFEEQAERTPDYIALHGCTIAWMHGAKLQNTNYKIQTNSKFQNTNYKQNGVMHLTYKELNEQSHGLAGWLMEKGVQPDTIVGIMMERSIAMIIGIMGILKAGGAYLPIDPEYPQERIKYMLKDSNVGVLVTTPKLHVKVKAEVEENSRQQGLPLQVIHINTNPGFASEPSISTLTSTSTCQVSPANLAYIIYTSGTTGRPKGVMVEHRNLTNTIYWFNERYQLASGCRVLWMTSISFDVSVEEIFSTLTGGASLHIAGKNISVDHNEFTSYVQKWQINIIQLVPVLLKSFLADAAYLKSLKIIVCGGDRLDESLKDAIISKGYNLHNHYGPTEVTVDALACVCREGPVVIGRPIANVRVYILHGNRIQPLGVPGEIYISGAGIARGYLNNPGLTAEKFDHDLQDYLDYHDEEAHELHELTRISNNQKLLQRVPGKYNKKAGQRVPSKYNMQPCNHAAMQSCSHSVILKRNHPPHSPIPPFPHNPIYRTGDLARWLPDSSIEFLGRLDHQVKIRGFRIELGEIESQLLTDKKIKNAVVTVKTGKNGDKFLCAFLEASKVTDKLTALELRSFLSARLPDYMIPAYFTQIEYMPLTRNGKVNRRALPDPGLIWEGQYAAPRDQREGLLVKTWEQVLGKEPIGIDDNFFTIGGDSIKALQIAARVKNSGYNIEMKDIFREPTVARLAPLLKKIQRIPPQEIVTGSVPLTPIQRWFFENHFVAGHHYNQSIMLYWREGIEPKALEAVFTQLQRHHDALRMTSRTDNGKIGQYNHGLEYPLWLTVYDFKEWKREKALATMEQRAEEIQASIDLEKGPLLKAGLFKMDDGDRLLIVLHHLVIDGISWRILFEDIENLYQQYKKGRPLTLPLKTDSFKNWAERLCQYADSAVFLKEKTYWKDVETRVIPAIGKDFADKNNHVKDAVSISFQITEQETGLLLTKVNHAFGTKIDDILLTALGLSVKQTFGNDKLLVAMEGHGREEILEGIDISRTIGWFTSLYPLVLDISFGADPGRQIKEIKETLRKVPNKGIGYGILKYLTKEENKKKINFKLTPQITFNYLGQFDADTRQRSFTVTQDSCGQAVSLENQRASEIEISAIIAAKRLAVKIVYNKKHFKPGTMEKFRDNYQSALRDTILYCQSRKKRELTPADLTYPGLSIEKLAELEKQYALEDIFILSPMQEGKLFYTLYRPHSPAGISQMKVLISGTLNLPLFKKSLNELFKRYDILRTVFVYEGVDLPLQIILKERQAEVLYKDLRKIMDNSDRHSIIDTFAREDRARHFDLTNDVLMRVGVLQTGDSQYEIVWSLHHILMDGWCEGILFKEFMEIYCSFMESRPNRLTGVRPYKEYIRWLMKQDDKEPGIYWKKYLENYDKVTSLPKKKGAKNDPQTYKFEKISFRINETKTAGLYSLATGNQVTLSTVFQAIWGIILSQYNRQEDILFGAVVSGRPPAIKGIETMIGLFINTIPVRMCCKPGTAFNQLVRQVQEKAVESEPYHYYPLARIQANTILKGSLLDHILVFENYPLAEQLEGLVKSTGKSAFSVENFTEYTQPDYNFHLVIQPGNSLKIEFRYNQLVYDKNFMGKLGSQIEEVVDKVINNNDIHLEDIQVPDGRLSSNFFKEDRSEFNF